MQRGLLSENTFRNNGADNQSGRWGVKQNIIHRLQNAIISAGTKEDAQTFGECVAEGARHS